MESKHTCRFISELRAPIAKFRPALLRSRNQCCEGVSMTTHGTKVTAVIPVVHARDTLFVES